jgi:L-ribulose-5-phosphate 4-epimerase
MNYSEYKQQVYDTTLSLVDIQLIRLSAGNVSVRLPDGNVAITPSAILYRKMVPEDIVIVDINGDLIEGDKKPSSEKALHTDIYKARPDVNAVVHAHSVYSIAFSTVEMELPLVCVELFSVGGPVPVMGYYCPGTPEVGKVAAEFFASRPRLKSLLMKNHGMVAVGKNLDDAYQNAYKTEIGAEIYHLALQTGRKPQPLTEENIQEIMARYQKPQERK